ncbi:aldose 1-epimerase family protein [Martelella alba]|uniref:DUF4432 family protein n=1 Tax=Martelella alba TaxID=2590451 RepID=A0ABY2SJK5_9HYPH|nr:aldose 1-epimerase family protein [Martelella alba]TKI04251.1 DUF4432 family protein [Martelella alba]
MSVVIHLQRNQFSELPVCLVESAEYSVTLFKYRSGIEAVTLRNRRGFVTLLPYFGQMIWDAEFDGHTLKMANPFSEPKQGVSVVDSYGCFAFHSGLLSNGCPGPEDDHPLHGEMPCAPLDSACLILEGDSVVLGGEVEYVKGFGHHYRAVPTVRLAAGETLITIGMKVTNLASVAMPLQYMCHMNYAYLPGAVFSQNIPAEAFALRTSVPAHVHPTPQWRDYTAMLAQNPSRFGALDQPQLYDPEIVFFADNLAQYAGQLAFFMQAPDGGPRFVTRFASAQFNYATRWILYNGDQRVAAFVLPATCRPEGRLAARRAGALIQLAAGETREFQVTTGLDG